MYVLLVINDVCVISDCWAGIQQGTVDWFSFIYIYNQRGQADLVLCQKI